MLDIIKTVRICDNGDLTLVKFDSGGYEIQYSEGDTIVDTEGLYTNKKDALKVFDIWEKDLMIGRL